jgi:hypothetical protein
MAQDWDYVTSPNRSPIYTEQSHSTLPGDFEAIHRPLPSFATWRRASEWNRIRILQMNSASLDPPIYHMNSPNHDKNQNCGQKYSCVIEGKWSNFLLCACKIQGTESATAGIMDL